MARYHSSHSAARWGGNIFLQSAPSFLADIPHLLGSGGVVVLGDIDIVGGPGVASRGAGIVKRLNCLPDIVQTAEVHQ